MLRIDGKLATYVSHLLPDQFSCWSQQAWVNYWVGTIVRAAYSILHFYDVTYKYFTVFLNQIITTHLSILIQNIKDVHQHYQIQMTKSYCVSGIGILNTRIIKTTHPCGHLTTEHPISKPYSCFAVITASTLPGRLSVRFFFNCGCGDLPIQAQEHKMLSWCPAGQVQSW